MRLGDVVVGSQFRGRVKEVATVFTVMVLETSKVMLYQQILVPVANTTFFAVIMVDDVCFDVVFLEILRRIEEQPALLTV